MEDEEQDVMYGTGFCTGTQVLVETEDAHDLGIVLMLDEEGLLYKSTHEWSTVGAASEEDIARFRKGYESESRKNLVRYLREYGIKYRQMLRLSREDMVDLCVHGAVEHHNKVSKRRVMVERAHSVETYVPFGLVRKLESLKDLSSDKAVTDFRGELDMIVASDLEL